MKTMKKTIVVLTCDMCGEEGAETVKVHTEKGNYRVDLCEGHFKDLMNIVSKGESTTETRKRQARMKVYDL